MSAHYRSPLSFGEDSLQAAGSAIDRLDALLTALAAYRNDGPNDPSLADLLAQARAAIEAALDDDLNISPALGALFDLVRELNRRIDARSISTADAEVAARFLREMDGIFGLVPAAVASLPSDLQAMIDERAAARTGRDFAASDRLRLALAERGILVEDTRDGQRWRRTD
jgi:cysteinyl-tRNA synthetase